MFFHAASGLGQVTYFGNQAIIYSNPGSGWATSLNPFIFTNFPLDNNSAQAGFRFTAQQTAAVTEVQIYFSSVTGNPGYQVGLEADSSGLPAGAYLAPATPFAPVAGWNDIPLSTPVNVTAGNVYHLVVEWNPLAAPLGSSNAATLELSSQPDYFFYPQNGTSDTQLGADENNGGGWNSLSEEPVFLVNYSGVWSGNPYSTGGNGGSTGTYWEDFTVPSTIIIGSVGTFAADPSASPATLTWTLTGPGASPPLNTGALAVPGQLAATFAWVDAPTAPMTLVPGAGYHLSFSSPGASKTMSYQILVESPNIPATASGFNIFGAVSYGGTTADEGHSINQICGLCATSEIDPDDDIPFRFQVITGSPTPTPTSPFLSVCDDFFVSKNIFSPSQGPVSIQVNYCRYPGAYSLRIYNSAGEHIKTLDDFNANAPVHQTYSWDGTNKYGNPCASGIYLFYLLEPFSRKVEKILLVR
jgi:hypothetical protein